MRCCRHCSINVALPHDRFNAMSAPIPGLRDIHLPPSPGWWPPAPAWWLLAAVLVIATAWAVRRILRLCRDRHRIVCALNDYDRALAAAHDAPAKLAAVSLQLRRAARARDPNAALLEGDAWLRFLDGDDPARPFANGAGRLLRDGGFRRTLDDDIASTMAIARARFIALLEHEHA
jgi:hypothetical protein